VPFYDYVCEKCGHEMEVMHSVHGHGPSACPSCGGMMKKAITAAAVHYKGSGWARKDRTVKAAKSAETKAETKAETPVSASPETVTGAGDTAKASD
jgi:putative FmdB family regulatory protein